MARSTAVTTNTEPKAPDECSNCRFYKRYSDKLGGCRRKPPEVIPEAVLTTFGRMGTVAVVTPDFWCGEHKPVN